VRQLRVTGGPIGDPQPLAMGFGENQGALGSNAHFIAALPGQAPIPYPVGHIGFGAGAVNLRDVPALGSAAAKKAGETVRGLNDADFRHKFNFGLNPRTQAAWLIPGPMPRIAVKDIGEILGNE
jgi:hypothetical protein